MWQPRREKWSAGENYSSFPLFVLRDAAYVLQSVFFVVRRVVIAQVSIGEYPSIQIERILRVRWRCLQAIHSKR